MARQLGKMSAMLKEMSERLLRNPEGFVSSEAAHVALMLAKVAWNGFSPAAPRRKAPFVSNGWLPPRRALIRHGRCTCSG